MLLQAIATTFFCLTICPSVAQSTFYGYGTDIEGLPLFYSDGTAYLGYTAPLNAQVATNITLQGQNTTDSTFTATPTNTSLSSNWTSTKLFINNNGGAFDVAGFVSVTNDTTTTTGFDLFGTMLVWISTSGDLVSQWYAEQVADGLYVVKWNVENAATDTAVPVVLKNLAPAARR